MMKRGGSHTNKKGGKSSSTGLLQSLGMRLSGSNLVLALLIIFLLYAYWDSHQLYHLIEEQQEFNVVVNRVVDGDTFVATIQDTYGEDLSSDITSVESLPAGEVCAVPVPCKGSGGDGSRGSLPADGVASGGGRQCCRGRKRLLVKGGLMGWFRLRRIDAPELPSPTRPEAQPFALEAKSALEGVLLRGEPLLPVGHSANEMMLQAAYILDHPVLPADSDQHPPKKMSRSELAKSQVITLPRWGDDDDDDGQDTEGDTAAADDYNHQRRHPPPYQQQQQEPPMNPTTNVVNNKGIVVSLRIVEQDKSGRYVVDAFVQTSPLSNAESGRLWVSYEMVRAGLAWGYASTVATSSSSSVAGAPSASSSPLVVSVAEVFVEPLVVAMSAARKEGRGLWSTTSPPAVEPWRWRIESTATAAASEARDNHYRGRRSRGGGGHHDDANIPNNNNRARHESSSKQQHQYRQQDDDVGSTRSKKRVGGGRSSKRGGRWDRRPTY